MSLTWATPAVLLLLPLTILPLLPRQKPALVVSTLGVAERLAPTWRCRLAALEPWLQAAVLVLVVLALAGPVTETAHRTVVRQGVDLMLVLDVSASMGAADIRPDRLSAAREAAAAFIAARDDDRIGVVLFAGLPYLLSPPTLDRGPLIARLREVRPDPHGSGTALGDALAAAAARLRDSQAASRALILLTDGSSNRGRIAPAAAGRAAAALDIRVYTIGYGTREGAVVPLAGADSQAPPVLDRLAEETLQDLARQTGGRYFRAASAADLEAVYRRIDALETSPLEVRETRTARPWRPLLTLAALGLAGLELLAFRLWLRRRP